MTYGEIRLRLTQLWPGVSLDLIDGWILDRYQSILDKLTWQRLQVEQVITTKDEYNTGTVAVTKGSAVLTGTDTVWAEEMTGRIIRVAVATSEGIQSVGPTYYEFTWSGSDPTLGSLDRGWEDEDATGLSYRINQNIYPLPAGTRLIHDIRNPRTNLPLKRLSLAQLNELAAGRTAYGDPEHWCLYMDQNSDPPVPQVEFYPIPTRLQGLIGTLIFEEMPDGTDTAVSLLPWVRPAALIAGVQMDIARHLKEWNSLQSLTVQYIEYLSDMVRMEAQRIGPSKMRLEDRFTRHRRRRYTR